jgi:predicted amino acid dehydrogenase
VNQATGCLAGLEEMTERKTVMTAFESLADLREQGGRHQVANAPAAAASAEQQKSHSTERRVDGLHVVPDAHQRLQEAEGRADSAATHELHERLRLDRKYVRIDGCYVYDADGVRYADFAQSGAFPLATVEELSHDEQQLLCRAARLGEGLRTALEELQREFPMLVADVRGHGLTFALDFAFDHIEKTQGGMLAISQNHGMLLDVVLSYLLNVEHIRVAPSCEGDGIRIELPLTAEAAICEKLTSALRRVLNALQGADAGALLAHLMAGRGRNALKRLLDSFQRYGAKVLMAHFAERTGLTRSSARYNGHNGRKGSKSATRIGPSESRCNRFAYVVHLLGPGDMRRFDPSLERFTDVQVELFRKSMAGFLKPFPLDHLVVQRPDGSFAEGELIVLPHTPAELLAMGRQAVDLVQSAVDLGVARGARVVGLGGFSSIISYGGNALEERPGVTVTSGNSLTTWAGLRSVELACAEEGRSLAQSTVAVVGANGAIGHALSKFFAERAGQLILVGNPRNPEASLRKLQRVAKDCRRHVARLAAAGRKFLSGSLAAELAARPEDAGLESRITLTTDIDRYLPTADIILTATKEVLPFIKSCHLGEGALVCDVSRPFNVAPEVIRQRKDVRLVGGGGLIKAPDSSVLGYIEESDRPKVLLSCAAETIMLALSGYQSKHLCGHLDTDTIERIGSQAESFGFSVVH